MEECGICITRITKTDLCVCMYCKFKICVDCHDIGVKLNIFSTFTPWLDYYCSTNCFYKNHVVHPSWIAAILNNYTSMIYCNFIRTHQEKCWKTIQYSHIAKFICPYVINDIGIIICEYLL